MEEKNLTIATITDDISNLIADMNETIVALDEMMVLNNKKMHGKLKVHSLVSHNDVLKKLASVERQCSALRDFFKKY